MEIPIIGYRKNTARLLLYRSNLADASLPTDPERSIRASFNLSLTKLRFKLLVIRTVKSKMSSNINNIINAINSISSSIIISFAFFDGRYRARKIPNTDSINPIVSWEKSTHTSLIAKKTIYFFSFVT